MFCIYYFGISIWKYNGIIIQKYFFEYSKIFIYNAFKFCPNLGGSDENIVNENCYQLVKGIVKNTISIEGNILTSEYITNKQAH